MLTGIAAPRATEDEVTRNSRRVGLSEFDMTQIQRKRGENSVYAMYVESTFSTSFPFASDFSFTLFHSGSSWNDFQFAAAASRLGC